MIIYCSCQNSPYVVNADQLFILTQIIAKDLLQGSIKHMGKSKGQLQGRGVVPLFDGYDGLPGYLDPIGQFLLGHLPCVKAHSTRQKPPMNRHPKSEGSDREDKSARQCLI